MTDTNLDQMFAEAAGDVESGQDTDQWGQAEAAAPASQNVDQGSTVVPPRPTAKPFEGADEPQYANTVINVLDVLRGLQDKEREVATQLVSQGKEVNSEGEIIVTVIHANSMLIRTVDSLLEAKDHEAVERAFYLMKLDKSLARNLSSLVRIFVEPSIDTDVTRDHIELARSLVSEIEDLSSEDMRHIQATKELLDSAQK